MIGGLTVIIDLSVSQVKIPRHPLQKNTTTVSRLLFSAPGPVRDAWWNALRQPSEPAAGEYGPSDRSRVLYQCAFQYVISEDVAVGFAWEVSSATTDGTA